MSMYVYLNIMANVTISIISSSGMNLKKQDIEVLSDSDKQKS